MTRSKSPFPGWDPYLQRFWRDVHQSLIVYTRDLLRSQLPSDLRARIEERVVLEATDWPDAARVYVPDVAVVERSATFPGSASSAVADTIVAEPLKLSLQAEPLTEGYLEILDMSSGGRVITTIEFLSPTNKTSGPGLIAFQKKQQECLKGRVSLVEIDLIRGGEHNLVVPEGFIPPKHRLSPRACVTLAWEPSEVSYYPISIRQRLPAIHIPLRQTDPPATLDIQAVFDLAYANGDYGADIDYRAAPEVKLTPEEAQWADAHLRDQGLR